jgi:hypothetical protein
METNKDIHAVLSEQMKSEQVSLSVPLLAKIEVARKLIAARQPLTKQGDDFFMTIASFLNFKVKLYHAICLCIIIGGSVYFASSKPKQQKNTPNYDMEISSLASINSSTVLSSIKTLINNK